MCLLVVHDLARLPRTSAVVQGMPEGRPWDEAHLQRAITYTLLQSIHRLLWVGLRIKGEPPEVRPYPIPRPGSKGPAGGQDSASRRPDPRKQAYLERFAPRRKHLTLVRDPPKDTTA